MVLFHENDNHFNLIVSEESDLATLGSLSYRFNVGPILTIDDTIEEEDEYEGETVLKSQNDGSKLLDLQKELKKCREIKNKIENEYKKCEQELRNKTEEAEILKVEVKDLKEILKLKDECDLKEAKQDDASFSEKLKSSRNRQSGHPRGDQLNCNKCGFKTMVKNQLERHELIHKKEEEFNCRECDFQTISNFLLDKHLSLKHTPHQEQSEEEIKCRNCGEKFSQRWKLMTHRKQNHINTVALCKNNLLKKCIFSAESCWWNHKEDKDELLENVGCFICDETFETKAIMMVHRKNKHKTFVRKCNNFLQNNCKFEDKSCWFMHDEVAIETDDTIEKETNENKTEKMKKFALEKETNENKTEKMKFASVFQKDLGIRKPLKQSKVEKEKKD